MNHPEAPVIAAIGLASPEHHIDAARGLNAARLLTPHADPHWLQSLYASSGVERRGSVLTAEDLVASCAEARPHGPTTSQRLQRFLPLGAPLAETAARSALAKADEPASRVTHLVTVSCTGAESPGLDHALIERLALSPDVSRTHLGFMGCHGAMNALRVASAFARSDHRALVLVVCLELCSLHYQSAQVPPDQLVANAIFADGSAAAVVRSHGPGIQLLSFASRVFPGTPDLMGWHIGDHGFRMRLSPRVPPTIRRALAPWISPWLQLHNTDPASVGAWAVHPGGRDVLSVVERALALDRAADPSRQILRDHGNMSSATVLWVLDALTRHHDARSIVALSFGPGLTAEAALLQSPARDDTPRTR